MEGRDWSSDVCNTDQKADIQKGMRDAVEADYKLAKKGETVLMRQC